MFRDMCMPEWPIGHRKIGNELFFLVSSLEEIII